MCIVTSQNWIGTYNVGTMYVHGERGGHGGGGGRILPDHENAHGSTTLLKNIAMALESILPSPPNSQPHTSLFNLNVPASILVRLLLVS